MTMYQVNKYEPLPVYLELKKAYDNNLRYFRKDLDEFVIYTGQLIYSYYLDNVRFFTK